MRTLGNAEDGKLSIRTVDLVYSDADGAYVRSGVEAGELAITSPVQAPFDGMSITVMERLEDGSVKVHEPDKGSDTGDATATSATVAVTGPEGSPQ